MSFRPMIWAWEVDGLTPPTKLVLMSLANHAKDDGSSCYPSVEQIAKEACLSVRSVQYALKWLEQNGYIRIKVRHRDTHQFRLLMGLKMEATRVQDLHPSEEPRVQDVRPRVQNLQFEGAGDAPEPRIEPRIEPRTLFAPDDEASEATSAAARSPRANKADDLIATWNRHCSGIHKLTRVNDARRALVLKRVKEDFNGDPAEWAAFCERIGRSDFLNGRTPRGWKPTFDWLMRPEKINNALEGTYDNDRNRPAPLAPGQWREAPGTI